MSFQYSGMGVHISRIFVSSETLLARAAACAFHDRMCIRGRDVPRDSFVRMSRKSRSQRFLLIGDVRRRKSLRFLRPSVLLRQTYH